MTFLPLLKFPSSFITLQDSPGVPVLMVPLQIPDPFPSLPPARWPLRRTYTAFFLSFYAAFLPPSRPFSGVQAVAFCGSLDFPVREGVKAIFYFPKIFICPSGRRRLPFQPSSCCGPRTERTVPARVRGFSPFVSLFYDDRLSPPQNPCLSRSGSGLF